MFYRYSTENRDYNAADGITDIAGNDTEQDLKGNLTEFEINAKEYAVEYCKLPHKRNISKLEKLI